MYKGPAWKMAAAQKENDLIFGHLAVKHVYFIRQFCDIIN